MKLKTSNSSQLLEAVLFLTNIIVIIQIVNTDDMVTLLEQKLGSFMADESSYSS